MSLSTCWTGCIFCRLSLLAARSSSFDPSSSRSFSFLSSATAAVRWSVLLLTAAGAVGEVVAAGRVVCCGLLAVAGAVLVVFSGRFNLSFPPTTFCLYEADVDITRSGKVRG